MKKQIAIIGGGPSAFLLAAFLDTEKFKVTIYEKNKTAGRKFLVAGKGGFNLTHSEAIDQLINRYTPHSVLKDALLEFTNSDFRNWLNKIGIPTFIGSSKRVYPDPGIKPIQVLNTILQHLKDRNITIRYEQHFTGWDPNNTPIINRQAVPSHFTVFCLGGGSWKVTGSDGHWLDTFSKKGILTKPFKASNCSYDVDWKTDFITRYDGAPLKNITITCQGKTQKGEAVITTFGLEGNAIYGLSPQIRNQLQLDTSATIHIDFKPTLTLEAIRTKIKSSHFKTTTDILKKELKLSPVQIALLKTYVSKSDYLNHEHLAQVIKAFPIELIKAAPQDEAISTVGGVALEAVSKDFELLALPEQFCIGEMLDWDAPTGGYLLQACVSSGVYLAKHLNKHH